jgi:very-short-patch-repair endonuclease
LDGGPVPGHSLFTGCLIEALTGGAVATVGRHFVTGSEIGLHVQRRVSTYPNANPRQTPDFGALELDNRGELIIELPRPLDDSQEPSHLGVDGIRPLNFARGADASPAPTSPQADVILESGVDSIKPRVATTKRAIAATRVDGSQSLPQAEPTAPAAGLGSAPADSRPETTTAAPVSDMQSSASPIVSAPQPSGRKPSSMLDAAFVAALDRHDLVRRTRRDVLTVVAADPTTAVTGWATWAAGRGLLTLVAEGNGLDATITSLLGQMPWLRALPAARSRFAAAAQLEVEAVDVALDSAPSLEAREVWIEEVAQHDMRVRVSGWLLAMLREPWAPGPELAAAPVQGSDLLSILCALATPVTVLLHHAVPTAPWLEQAVQTAAELIEFLPHQAVAIAVPGDLAHSLTRMRPESAVFAMARRGVVPLATKPPRPIDPAHSRTEHVLHAALARDRRTAGLFQPNVRVPVHGHERAIEVDLVARDALLAIQIDDWYQARDPQAYTRERMKDSFLSRAQFFVMRFLAEDIERRLEQTVNEIALGLAGRQASGSFVESSQ